ncbi:MAG: SHOCT domain-containing protein [Nakamurella sp.]
MFRRRGRPGLLGTVARTAVVAGTATATAGAVNRHQQQKQAEKQAYADQQAAEQQPEQQPVYQAPPPQYQQPQYQQPQYQQPEPAAEPAPAGDDLVSKINQLAQLKDSGVLSEEEFSAAKGKLLGM